MRPKLVLATGAVAFAIAAVALTLPELILGGAVAFKQDTTLFGGGTNQPPKPQSVSRRRSSTTPATVVRRQKTTKTTQSSTVARSARTRPRPRLRSQPIRLRGRWSRVANDHEHQRHQRPGPDRAVPNTLRFVPAVPVFSSLHGYRHAWLGGDALAGLALLAIAVPAQLATARLAGMPPLTGLYAFVAGTVMIGLLGGNPQMSVGADSTIAPLFAVGVAHLASTGSPHYVALVGLLAVGVGVLVALVGIMRLGWIAEFLSAPIITGFFAGVAVIIIVHQLSDLFGLPAGGGSTLHRVNAFVGHQHQTNGWTLGIGVGVFAIIAGARRVDRRAPGALVALMARPSSSPRLARARTASRCSVASPTPTRASGSHS